MKRRQNLWAYAVVGLAAIFFALPLIAMTRFAFQRVPVISLGWSTLFKNWTLDGLLTILQDPEFLHSLLVTTKVSFFTVLLTLALMIPTVVWVHLVTPKWRNTIEAISILPYVVPPIALVVGVSGTYRSIAPWFLSSNYSLVPFYAILAMPFTFRSLDAGIKALDLRTLVNAARSLGASPTKVTWTVLLPNLRSSLISSGFLTLTVVLGEFTIASLLLKRTLPMFMAQSQGREPQGALGLSVLLLIATSCFLALASYSRRKSPGELQTAKGRTP